MSISNAAAMQGANPSPSIPPSMTLRSLLDTRRGEGRRMSVEEAVAVIVPVCLDLQERHARGEMLYVHPSAIAPGSDGVPRFKPRLALVPTHAGAVFSRATHAQACIRSARCSTRWSRGNTSVPP
jgi:hypothetical protein